MPALIELNAAEAPRTPWYAVELETVTYSSCPSPVTSVTVLPLTDWTRPEMLGTSIVIAVAAIGEVAVGDVPLRLPRTATTSPTFTALSFTVACSRV